MPHKVGTMNHFVDVGVIAPSGLFLALAKWLDMVDDVTGPIAGGLITVMVLFLLYYRVKMARIKTKIAEAELHRLERENREADESGD